MIHRTLVLTVAAIAVLGGCKRYTYTVNLKPVPTGLERSLSMDRGTVQSGSRTPKRTVTTTIGGMFAGAEPADIGGAGSYTTYPTSLGTLHVYIERFRGDDDLAGQWERQQAAIDTAVDLLLTWIDAKLASEQGADKLRAFVDHGFRRDLKNAGLYARLVLEQLRPRPDEHPEGEEARRRSETVLAEFCARLAQYAIEHGYFTPAQVPELLSASEGVDDHGRALMSSIRRLMLRRMGRDEGDPSFMPAGLADTESWNIAFRAHIKESAAASNRLAAWAAAAESGLQQRELDEQLQHLGIAAIRVQLMLPFDELALGLQCSERPFATNGAWDDAGKRVSWTGAMETEKKDADGLPLLAYAVWSTPNVEVQTKHFGSAALHEQRLATYCLWRNRLSAPEAEQWEGFVGKLTPGPELAGQLGAFRFSGHEADEKPASGVAAIMESLNRAD